MKIFQEEYKNGFIFLPRIGIGYYPVPNNRPYDHKYFDKYQKMSETKLGKELTKSRIELISRHYDGLVLDVGIGSGQFVTERKNTVGFDVNQKALKWLKEKELYRNLYTHKYNALSFWDSLEHIDEPQIAIQQARNWVFVSIPIFSCAEHVIRSHHFRPTEHIWYFTHQGIINFFESEGFELKEHNTIETSLGRDGIGSYAFKRKPISDG